MRIQDPILSNWMQERPDLLRDQVGSDSLTLPPPYQLEGGGAMPGNQAIRFEIRSNTPILILLSHTKGYFKFQRCFYSSILSKHLVFFKTFNQTLLNVPDFLIFIYSGFKVNWFKRSFLITLTRWRSVQLTRLQLNPTIFSRQPLVQID